MKRALAVLVLAACGGSRPPSDPPRPPPDAAEPAMDQQTVEQTVAGLIEFWHAMAAIVEQRAGDCDAMAADLDQLFTTSQPLFEFVAQAKIDPDANALLAAEVNRHADEITPYTDKVGDGIVACGDNRAMIDVMQRMPEL